MWYLFHLLSHVSLCISKVFIHFQNVFVKILKYIFHMVFDSVNFFKILCWYYWIYWYLLIFWKNFILFSADSIRTLNDFAFSIFAFSFCSFFAWFFMQFSIFIYMRWKRTWSWCGISLAVSNTAHLFFYLIHIISHWIESSKAKIIIESVKHWVHSWFLDIEKWWHRNH
jgi:hypothetical protein